MSNETDAQVARRTAIEAGELLLEVRGAGTAGMTQAEQRAVGDEGDRRSNDLLLRRLSEVRPDDAVLSEESLDDRVRVTRDRVWIIDPLDGTAEFRTDRDEFAVHVALWERGRLVAGCIALPERKRVRTTDDAVTGPASLDLNGDIRVVVSRSHIPTDFEVIAARLQQQLIEAGNPDATVTHYSVGSVGGKVDEVMLGNAAVYLFSGGLSEWDAAAPFVVAEHQGYVVRQVDGTEFTYNHENPRVGSGYVAHPALADMLAQAVAGTGL
jgi:3'(2'), 5'-bisphosphate nucleotidase